MIRAPQFDPVLSTSAVSGLVWALVAMFLGFGVFGHAIWGGVLASPFIGVLIGRLSAPLHDRPRWMQVAGSLFFLYVAAAAFAFATGLASLLTGGGLPPAQVGFVAVLAVWWGLTFGGLALVLWPLSYGTHRLVWQAARSGELPSPPVIRMTPPAVRWLGTRMALFAMLGYVVWAVLALALAAGSPARTAEPWWSQTGLMTWSTWALLGLMVWLIAPLLALGAARTAAVGGAETSTYPHIVGVVGFALLAFPVLFFTAGWIVGVVKVSLVQSWATEGRVFSTVQYYRNTLSAWAPLLTTGALGICLSRVLSSCRRT